MLLRYRPQWMGIPPKWSLDNIGHPQETPLRYQNQRRESEESLARMIQFWKEEEIRQQKAIMAMENLGCQDAEFYDAFSDLIEKG